MPSPEVAVVVPPRLVPVAWRPCLEVSQALVRCREEVHARSLLPLGLRSAGLRACSRPDVPRF